MKPLRRKFYVPIFRIYVRIIVADRVLPERKRLEKIFGLAPTADIVACCCYNGPHFALIFEAPTALRRSIVAHEVFHLTHRILEFGQVKISDDTNELAAMLHEFLTEQVNRILDSNFKTK